MDQMKVDDGRQIVDSPELRAAAKALEDLLKQGEEAAWRIGACYNRIVEEKLAEKSGYRRARDFFATHFEDVPQSTLSHDGAVAKAFSEAVAADYGVTLLSALLTYEKLAGLNPKDSDPGSVQIKVPGEDKPRPFSECHRADLLKAIQALKGPSGDEKAATPDEEALLEKLHKQLGEHSPIALTSRQGREGALVTFTVALKENELGMLLDALMKVLADSDAAKKATETMKEFTKEFTKGMDQWVKGLEGKNPFEQ
ncbi:MAG TPA: hypothetical protein VKE49_01330 [Myxococcaceae bacterium]|nr:hypothetical protein [Myxococcaceae bacterium]